MMANAPLVGAVRLPELKTTVSVAVGTCCGSQLVALFQSVDVEPFQVSVVARALLLPSPSPTSDRTNTNKVCFMVLIPCVNNQPSNFCQ